MKKYILLSTTFCLSCFLGVSLAIAQTCPAVTENHPSCEAMGFSKTMDCNGATTIIKCPFDTSYYFCHKIGSGGPTCDTNVKDLIAMMGGNMQNVPYMFYSPGACNFSNKCYINSTYTLDNSSNCDASQYICANGIGDNNAYFSFASAGCDISSSAKIATTYNDYSIGNNVYIEVPVNLIGTLMKGGAIFKGDGNTIQNMVFYDEFSSYNSSLSGGYNGGAVVLAGNTTIYNLYLGPTKNVPLLVGDDSGKSVRLELGAVVASSTNSKLCIGLRPGGSVNFLNETTEYNNVTSGKKEKTSNVVIATAEVCLSTAGGTTSGGGTTGGEEPGDGTGCGYTVCCDSSYTLTSCPTNASCSACENKKLYRFERCAAGYTDASTSSGISCCDSTYYKYTQCPEGSACSPCGSLYKWDSCLEGFEKHQTQEKCCPQFSGGYC